MADPHRTFWNQQQQVLQRLLQRPEMHPEFIQLFLQQHAVLHAPDVPMGEVPAALEPLEPHQQNPFPGFDEQLWDGLSEAAVRRIPPGGEHSIVWMIWHIARIEDITMNLLAAGTPQLFEQDGWAARLNAPIRDTGSAMDAQAIAELSAAIDIPALRAYRTAAGCRTRQIVRELPLAEFKRKVDPVRLQQVLEQGAVMPEARWLVDYWGGRTIAGLLLMPATRHILVHLNEAAQVKARLFTP